MTLILQALVSGIGTGAVYALIAFGISLTWLVTRTLNFAHGDVLMVGVFASFVALAFGSSAVTALVVAVAVGAVLGLALEKSVFFPLRKRPGSLVWLLGVVLFAAVLRAVGIAVFESRSYPPPFSFGTEGIDLRAGAVVPVQYLWIGGVAITAALVLDFVMSRTHFGRAVRAIAVSREVAELMGVNTERIMAVTFAVAAAAGTLAGLFIAPVTFVSASLGWVFTLKGFTAAVLGGIGRIRGALVGGFLLGIFEQALAALEATTGAGWLQAGYRDAGVFLLLIAVLVVKPGGLSSRPEEARYAA